MSFVVSLANMRYLDPADVGRYNGTLLAKDFAVHINGGENEALRLLLPKGGEPVDTQALCDTVFSMLAATIGMYLVAALVIHLTSDIMPGDGLIRAVVAMVFVSEYLQYYFLNILKGTNRFPEISRFILVTSLISLSTCPLVIFGGFDGFLAGRLLNAVASAFALNTITGVRPQRWSSRGWQSILSVGIPLQATLVSAMLNSNAGRLYLSIQGDHRNLGLLVFALYFTVPFTQLITNLSSLSFFRHAKGGVQRSDDARSAFYRNAVVATGALGVLWATDWIIHLLFRQYAEIVPATQLLILTTITGAIYADRVSFIMAKGGGIALALFQVASATLMALVAHLLSSRAGLPALMTIAWASLLASQFLAGLVIWWIERFEALAGPRGLAFGKEWGTGWIPVLPGVALVAVSLASRN